jgi:hypothetical protein
MREPRMYGRIIVLLCCLLWSREVFAEKKGEAGIALEDTPIYPHPDSLEAGSSLKKGQPVGALRSVGLKLLGLGQYIFDEKNGRVQVTYFPAEEDPTRGKFYNGWVDPAKLAKFYYDCSCGASKDDCDPIVTRGFRFSFTWNSCFNEAWERKAAELKSQSTESVAPKKETAEERLRKLEDLLKKGLITKEEYRKKREEILNSF